MLMRFKDGVAQFEGVNQVILQFDLTPSREKGQPGNVEVKIAYRPSKSVPQSIKQGVNAVIQNVPAIQVQDLVQFQLYFPTQESK